MPPPPVELFFSCAREDEDLRRELEKHLAGLQRDQVVRAWHDGLVAPGEIRAEVAAERLGKAQLILLLVSADYLASEARHDGEVERALARHGSGAARVIPILLRECDWRGAPFGKLDPLPRGGKPVTSWPNRDEAWADVARGIREAAETIRRAPPVPRYPDTETQALAERLHKALARKRRIAAAGGDTAEITREILSLRRQLREGGKLRPGDVLGDGRYLLLEEIGHGGFGTVWRALDHERAAPVAVKVLHTHLAGDPIRRERFHRGARAMAALDHETVTRVLDPAGEDGGFHYFVMELLPGGDLRRAVLEDRMPKDRVLSLILRVGDALAAAHDRGLVHRDVKPANILLDGSGDPRLTDFDLVADPNSTGGTHSNPLGSFLYSAPEMMSRPQDADVCADVYSLGMTAVFGLHGEDLPLEVVKDAPALIDDLPVGAGARDALKRAVEWKREGRFRDVRAFCEALRAAMATAGPASRGQSFARRDLRYVSLCGKDLRGADLRGADLRGADLVGANLHMTDLDGADLGGADLTEARLVRASLKRAVLAGARLVNADLSFARLLGADLTGADLSGARLRFAALVGARIDLAGLDPAQLFGAAAPGVAPALALAPPPSRCLAAAVSPDGVIVASGHADGSIRLLSAESGAALRTLPGSSRPLSLAFSPDGRALVHGSLDGSVWIWDVSSGAPIRALRGHQAEVVSVAVSPDGSVIASGSADGAVRIWDARTGAELRALEGHAGAVRSLAFSPRGDELASGADDAAVWLWTAAEGWAPRAALPHGGAIGSVAFSPDGELLAAGAQDGKVQLWKVREGVELRRLEGHSGGVWSASFSPDGKELATYAQDDALRLWDVQIGIELRVLSGRERAARRGAPADDAPALPPGWDALVQSWVAMSAAAPAGADLSRAVLRVAFSPDGEHLATEEADEVSRSWSLTTGEARRVPAKNHGPRRLRVLGADVARAQSGGEDLLLAVTPDRRAWAQCLKDGRIELVRIPEVGSKTAVRLEGHQAPIRGLAFGKGSELLASGAEDRTIRVWDARTGELRRTLGGHTHSVLGVAFSPEARWLASASADGTVRLWDLETEAVRTLTGHMAAVASVAFHPSGAMLASASHDGTARIWGLDGACLAIFLPLAGDGWAALTPDGRYRLHGAAGGAFWHVIGLCRFEPDDLDRFLPAPLRIPDGEPLF